MKKREFIETEIVTEPPLPQHSAGRLEYHNGELCLRAADQLDLLPDGRIMVEHKWFRPGKRPFDQRLYELA